MRLPGERQWDILSRRNTCQFGRNHHTFNIDAMNPQSTLPGGAEELTPHLLYRTSTDRAEFATWRLAEGHEALVLFSTAEAARKYQAELPAAASYTLFQPPRDKLIAIFDASLAAGIRVAALDPLTGGARTLFDLGQIVAAAAGAAR
jgi:hypothetical protein